MLRELYIEDLAVIEKAEIQLAGGLNVFSGETGAGKSILINGINAVLGQRITKDIVRGGEKKAVITAVFDNMTEQLSAALKENGIDCDDDQIVISREINSDGGSVARLNSRPVSVALLRTIAPMLVNIHGQHDSRSLLSAERHLELIDIFAADADVLDDYKKSFRQLQNVSRELKKASADSQQKEVRTAQFAAIVNDIKPLELLPDEDTDIEKRFELADSSRELSQVLSAVVTAIYGSDEQSFGASSSVADASHKLAAFQEEFSDLEPIVQRLESVRIELDDISTLLMRFIGSVEIDPAEFARLSRRRDEILQLKRKYNTDVNGLIKLCETSGDELLKLTGSESNIEQLQKERADLLKEVSQKAAKLSDIREKAAKRFCESVANELEFLNMPNVTLSFEHTKGKLTVSGMDSIELLISANLGEPPKPIAKIASGGELSRIMLALKCVIADRDDIPTMIFDEIDTGVSGRAAQKIGIKLSELAAHRQVLCVTHLSQIAVQADEHILIDKRTTGGRTSTAVTVLDKKGRVDEIARILGGESVTETTIKNAEELIAEAASLKIKSKKS